MVVLRATRKVLKSIAITEDATDVSDNALGDWYVNRVVVDRKPLLLIVSSLSLLSIISPARDLKNLDKALNDLVRGRLERLGIAPNLLECEVKATDPVRVGKTVDKSVLGTLVDFAKALPYYLPTDGWGSDDLILAEERFAETPCRCGGSLETTIWPHRDSITLLQNRWGTYESPTTIH